MFFNRENGGASLRNASFTITEQGRAKLTNDFSSSSPTTRVLVALETCGCSCDLDDVARNAGMSRGGAESALRHLLRQGFVQTLNGGDL